MKRRDFLKGALAAGTAPIVAKINAQVRDDPVFAPVNPEYKEQYFSTVYSGSDRECYVSSLGEVEQLLFINDVGVSYSDFGLKQTCSLAGIESYELFVTTPYWQAFISDVMLYGANVHVEIRKRGLPSVHFDGIVTQAVVISPRDALTRTEYVVRSI